ncbi:MAG: hypothetical protein FWG67_08415 [Defluviitaleaceae bacterium]|nr:hypothetical protein [Defluviitaleaceae bacterium]
MAKNVKLSKVLTKYTVSVATAFALSSPFVAAQASTSIPVGQDFVDIQPFNGARFTVNPGGAVLVFHRSDQANNQASGSVHEGTILTVVNTITQHGRVQVSISGATGANAVWNGQTMWINGAALTSQTTWWSGGPAF